jgi:hypothetical protein
MSITFEEVEGLCSQIAAQRGKVDELEAAKKQENEKLDFLEKQLIETLKKLGKTSFNSKSGGFVISYRTSFKVPATPEARLAFFDYLKQKGIFEGMISVHSATLNSFCKKELEAAQDRGEGLDFAIPGIEPASVQEILSFKKPK